MTDQGERWALMARVALGQSKMVVRPIAGILHIIVYAGFVIINIEVLEIIIDGIFGTHRVLSFLGVSTTSSSAASSGWPGCVGRLRHLPRAAQRHQDEALRDEGTRRLAAHRCQPDPRSRRSLDERLPD
jgi:hypothetical protein